MHLLPSHSASRPLFVCTWRATCPLRPRRSRTRRWVVVGLFALLATLSTGYAYVTDEARVRGLAETYLGRILGADVAVGAATLGLFEGLRLGEVSVRVPATADLAEDDRLVFTARDVTITYDPFALLAGRLSASDIVAVDPHVRLVEDVRDGGWNVQHLGILSRPRGVTARPFVPPEELPAVVLRNARVDVLARDGLRLRPQGGFGIEANLRPDRSGEGVPQEARYGFGVQTRNVAAAGPGGLGPRARGRLMLGQDDRTVRVSAELSDATFAAVGGLLPSRVAEWAQRRGVAMEASVPSVEYAYDPSAPPGERVRFEVRSELAAGAATLLPDLWLSRDELLLRSAASETFAQLAARMTHRPTAAAWLAESAWSWRPQPVRLEDARGRVTFTHAGIRDARLTGLLEGNPLVLEVHTGGYDVGDAMRLNISTPEGRPMQLPAVATYLGSLPPPVREVYDRFRPHGQAEIDFTIERVSAGESVRVDGEVRVLDGSFELDLMPYRLFSGRGVLRVAYDRSTNSHDLLLERLTARGAPGGVNADTYVRVDGRIGPLESASGLDISVLARGARHEPALVAALPRQVREAVRLFDPDFHAAPPPGLPPLDFRGDLNVRVVRPAGRDQRWAFDADVRAASFSGAFEAFPYPIRNATAELEVREDGLTLRRSRLARPASAGGGAAGVAGTLGWGRRASDGVRYDFTVAGSALPLDAALLAALPQEARDVARDLGLGGRAAVTAVIRGDTRTGLGYDVTLDVDETYAWPDGTTFAVVDAAGRVRLRPGVVELTNVAASRGVGRATVSGTIGTSSGGRSTLDVSAKDWPLDAALSDMLPAAAREAWDALRPEGSADATLTFDGPTSVLTGGDAPSDGEALTYDLLLRPQGLRATPAVLPYPFANVRGQIRVRPGRVDLAGVTASREETDALFRVQGTGDLTDGASPGGAWQLSLAASGVPADAELLDALPAGLADAARAVGLGGVIGVDVPQFRVTTRGDDLPPDVEFGGKVVLSGATLEPGLRLDDVRGDVQVSGAYTGGTLRSLAAAVRASTFRASGRPGRDLVADVRLDLDAGLLRIEPITGGVAGGLLEGSATLTWPEDDTPRRFDARMRVERVEVRELLGQGLGEGTLSAELQLGGVVGDADGRRGRGSIRVEGRDLYSLPIAVGLLQVTNLALPGNLAIRRAGADVAVDGQRMVLSNLTISTGARGDPQDALLVGGGEFDYAAKRWRVWLRPGRGGWDRFPVLGAFAGFARGELLASEIGGTLETPDVRADALPTVRAALERTFGD